MARSRSSSALGLYNAPSNKGLSYLKAAHSTPTLRRVTRSQSRKLEAPELQNERGRAGQFSDGAASSRWGQNKGSMNGKGLDLIQESSTKTPRRSSGRPVNPIGRDSLEDAEATNISGTTILPSEPDTDFDPEMMLEALPDLERAAKNVLDLLVPASTDPVSIVNMAKKLADPKNTQSRRLSRAKSKFESESSYFGSHSYIDAEKANVLILSALENKHNGLGHDWSPDSALQRANCARFALEVLLAKAGTDAPMQAIRNVEDVFPNFFMNEVAHDNQQLAMGGSALEKDTFNLALEIRTQFLIGHMEEQQYHAAFDPEAMLRDAFFIDAADDDIFESSQAPLRGFNLDQFGGTDKYLPVRFRDAAYERFNEMLLTVSEDGFVDIEELKSAFRWQRFTLRAAQWIRKRNDEIEKQLKSQLDAEAMRDAYFATPRGSHRLGSLAPRSDKTSSPAGSRSARHSAIPTESPRATDTQRSSNRRTAVHLLSRDQRGPENQAESRVISEAQGRRKSKSSFLNAFSIERIMKRQQRSREHSGLRRQSDLAQPSSLRESETNFEDRRQTLPAPSQARPVAVAEPREIPNSPQGSPHFVVQDDDFLTANDTGFSFDNDNSRIQIERSHSPPVVNRANQEAVHESTSTTGAPAAQTAALPSTEELWRAAKASISSQPHRGRNVRAAFIDRQENAHRISPISHEASARIAHRTQPEPGPSQKRQHHESADEEEVEETNGDFFQYDREVDIPRRRAEKPDQGRNKRQKTTQEAENQAISEVRRDLEETRRRATPAVPRIPPTTSSYKQQVRWTQSEDNRLIRLMGEYGTGWAKIERQNEAQPVRPGETRIEGRNQGQLKDRARNIKIKLLRDGLPLPRNFENVTMKASDCNMLRKKGIQLPDPEAQPT